MRWRCNFVKKEPESKYKIGDVVKIVDEPYTDCPFQWVLNMTQFCGKYATIVDLYWLERKNAYGYILDVTDWTWCENCFVVKPDLIESDSDLNDLFL